MPIVPLGLESYRRSDGFQPEVRLVNMFVEADKSGASPDNVMRMQRPGLVRYATAPAPSRGMYQNENVFGGAIFVAYGYLLGRIVGSAVTSIGTIDNDGTLVEMSGTFEKLFCLSAGKVYAWNGTAISVLAIPNGHIPTSIDTLNSYLIVGCSNGRFYWLEPGQAAIDVLNFANAESSPDGIVAVRRLIDELWFLGEKSTEIFQATGDIDAPFQKAGGRQYERGCLARNTAQRFDNSLRWVGNDGLVYSAQQVPQESGGDGISERLAQRTALPDAWIFGSMRHKFYVLRIPGQGTFAYDPSTDSWCEFATEGEDTWRAHVGVSLDDKTYAGDSLTGDIWFLDVQASTDGGLPMRRTVTGSVPSTSAPVRNDSISLGVGCSSDCTVMVRWKDGRDDFPAFYEDLEARSPVDVVTLNRLGSIEPPFRTFEITVLDDAKIRISGMKANEAWQ